MKTIHMIVLAAQGAFSAQDIISRFVSWLAAFDWNRCHFTVDLILMTALFAAPLPKRRGLPFRLAAGIVVCLAAAQFYPPSLLQFYMAIVPVFALTLFCCRVSPLDAAYGVCCGYAAQHIYSCLYGLFCIWGWEENLSSPPRVTLLLAVTFACTGAIVYLLFARKMGDSNGFLVNTRDSILSAVVILLAVLVISSQVKYPVTPGEKQIFCYTQVYDILCCLILLWMQVSQIRREKIQREFDIQQHLARQQKEQYVLTKETIDLINRKCHDLKHQVEALKNACGKEERESYIEEVSESIRIYDAALETGSEVLDTVLTEKSLWCEARQITLTCVADGARLSFLSPVDLYTIFGNALDNAVEYVSSLKEVEKRVISVSVWAQNGLVMIQIENPCEEHIHFEGDLPGSTKEKDGYHGYGLKSIRNIAEKYGGQMTVHRERGMFILRLSFPETV